MTQAQINQIKEASHHAYTLQDKHKKEMNQAQKNLLELQKKCDHLMPDGSSAWEGGFMFSACKICHENDL